MISSFIYSNILFKFSNIVIDVSNLLFDFSNIVNGFDIINSLIIVTSIIDFFYTFQILLMLFSTSLKSANTGTFLLGFMNFISIK